MNGRCVEAVKVATEGLPGLDALAVGGFVEHAFLARENEEAAGEETRAAAELLGLFLFGRLGEGERVERSGFPWEYALLCAQEFARSGDGEIGRLRDHLVDWRRRVG